MTKKNHTTLQLRSLKLNVNLGWRKKEREHEQTVLLDIDLHFLQVPKACLSDNLDDTVCYATLIEEIQRQLDTKDFRLIEHLSYAIYQIIKTHTPAKTKISVRITKFPKIKGLTGGACFCYEDK